MASTTFSSGRAEADISRMRHTWKCAQGHLWQLCHRGGFVFSIKMHSMEDLFSSKVEWMMCSEADSRGYFMRGRGDPKEAYWQKGSDDLPGDV